MTYSEILYEDNHLIAVNKNAGALVQGDKTGDTILPDDIKSYIKKKYNKPGDVFLGTVHRLDRPVSGLVLFARTSKATTRLNKAFKDNKIHKTYWAIVDNHPPSKKGILEEYLKKNTSKNKSFVTTKQTNKAKLSSLHYTWVGTNNQMHLLKIEPVTGRHHQIRVMLSNMSCCILGDLKYGANKANIDGNIALHAASLELIHPVKKEKIIIKAKPPKNEIWEPFFKFIK